MFRRTVYRFAAVGVTVLAVLAGAAPAHAAEPDPIIMAANDLVAAWGAVQLMRSWGIEIDVLTGPATDNDAGEDYAAKELRVPAANARTNAHKFTDLVEELVF